jgi:osmotically-inducible protein OsmY
MVQPPTPSPSDESLRTAVLARFASSGQGSIAHLRVGVLNGIAHLTGAAPSIDLYVMAAELAASVPGIRGVVNRIETPGAPSPSRKIDLDLKPGFPIQSKGESK